MKNQKLKDTLAAISESRTQKYNEEVERQKSAIESALFKYLEEKKKETDTMKRATKSHQTANGIWFEFELDAYVLPEVGEYIAEEFGISVDEKHRNKVFASFEA